MRGWTFWTHFYFFLTNYLGGCVVDGCYTSTKQVISNESGGWNERRRYVTNDYKTGGATESPLALKLQREGESWERYASDFVFVLRWLEGASCLSVCLNCQRPEAAAQVSGCRTKLCIFMPQPAATAAQEPHTENTREREREKMDERR